MMKTTISKISVSSKAGRVLLALLLSQTEDMHQLALIANVKRNDVPVLLDEIRKSLPYPGVGAVVEPSVGAEDSRDTTNKAKEESQEERVVRQIHEADASGNTKSQALSLVEAWKFLYPETNKVQELQALSASQWIKHLKENGVQPGREATTVFGWMSGVDDAFLKTRQFPKAWVNKIITGNSEKSKAEPKHSQEDVMDEWRVIAQQIIQGGKNNHGVQNSGANLLRIAGRVEAGAEKPT